MSKSELVKTIESQQKQIAKYEKKLKEVIFAYKSLLSEKEALESTLHALGPPTESRKTTTEDGGSGTSSEAVLLSAAPSAENLSHADSNLSLAPSKDGEGSGVEGSSDVQLDISARLEKLQNAIKTLTVEKSRIEAALTEDKKKLMKQLEGAEGELKAKSESFEEEKRMLTQQMKELKASVRQLQCLRETDEKDHMDMIKELQQKLAEAKKKAEKYKEKASLLENEIKDGSSSSKWNEAERQMRDMGAKVASLEQELADAREQAKASAKVAQLEREIARLKLEHKQALRSEQSRVEHLCEQVQSQTSKNYTDASSLEIRIAELAKALGDSEAHRQTELVAMEKLRARVAQLEQENYTLSATVRNSGFETLEFREKFLEVLAVLNGTEGATCEGAEEFLAEFDTILHKQCRKDIETLKEDFELYKMKMEAMLRAPPAQVLAVSSRNSPSPSSAPPENQQEWDNMRNTLTSLKLKLDGLQREKLSMEMSYEKSVSELKKAAAAAKEQHRKELAELGASCRKRISDMETEMHKQRERTLKLIAEKDQELHDQLECATTPLSPILSAVSSPTRHSPQGRAAGPPVCGADTSLFYVQELARKELEIQQLGREKRDAEAGLREVQHSAVSKELRYLETIEILKEKIRTLENSISRNSENANLEYLKNVLLSYMLTNDLSGKTHMLKAIGSILKFSPKELSQVKQHNEKWFSWASPGGAPGGVKKR